MVCEKSANDFKQRIVGTEWHKHHINLKSCCYVLMSFDLSDQYSLHNYQTRTQSPRPRGMQALGTRLDDYGNDGTAVSIDDVECLRTWMRSSIDEYTVRFFTCSSIDGIDDNGIT